MTSLKRNEPSNDNDDEMIREKLRAHHAVQPRQLLQDFDAACQKELYGEGFHNSAFVREERANLEKQRKTGYCCVCKDALTKNDRQDDASSSSLFDGEMCWCCKHVMADETLASRKCSKCTWPLECSLETCNKGFCSACIETITTDHEVYINQDIPRRLHPDGSGELLEYDDIHPFILCDCGICAWCGEDEDECCTDHVYQHCSCFP